MSSTDNMTTEAERIHVVDNVNFWTWKTEINHQLNIKTSCSVKSTDDLSDLDYRKLFSSEIPATEVVTYLLEKDYNIAKKERVHIIGRNVY
jgi:hypothetical protein